MSEHTPHIVGLGNALVDVVAAVEPEVVSRHGLTTGACTLSGPKRPTPFSKRSGRACASPAARSPIDRASGRHAGAGHLHRQGRR